MLGTAVEGAWARAFRQGAPAPQCLGLAPKRTDEGNQPYHHPPPSFSTPSAEGRGMCTSQILSLCSLFLVPSGQVAQGATQAWILIMPAGRVRVGERPGGS